MNNEYEPTSPSPEHELSHGEQFTLDLDRVNAVIESMLSNDSTDPAELKEAWAVRAVLAEEFVGSLEPTSENPTLRARVQFDIMVDKAILFEKTGDQLRYLEDLDAAEEFAYNENLIEVTESLTEELDEKIAELGTSPSEIIMKLRRHIDFANRDYLRELLADGMTYEDFLGNVYGMILEEGGDPDEVLGQLGLTE